MTNTTTTTPLFTSLSPHPTLGIIGGCGWMGLSMALQWLKHGVCEPNRLWLSSRSSPAPASAQHSGAHITQDNQRLVDHCDVVVLSVRPHQLPALKLSIPHALLISIMAGVSLDELQKQTQAKRIIRAMPNAAIEVGQSYTPWLASPQTSEEDKQLANTLLTAFGIADEITEESQLAYFTGLTGAGHAFLAYYGQCMIDAAIGHGIPENIAMRAVKQLFYGGGTLIHHEDKSLANIVKTFIDYAGTTAAGLTTLQKTELSEAIHKGLDAAYQKAASDMTQIS